MKNNKFCLDMSDKEANYYNTADETERTAFRDWIKDALHDQVVVVEFKKADGTLRTMNCTLKEELGATYTVTEGKEHKKTSPDVCVVWDTDVKGWRSFRWDRINKVTIDVTD